MWRRLLFGNLGTEIQNHTNPDAALCSLTMRSFLKHLRTTHKRRIKQNNIHFIVLIFHKLLV